LTLLWLNGKIKQKIDMNRNYELVVILDPDTKGEEQEKLLKKYQTQITEAEGKIFQVQGLGKKELACPVAKKEAGVFWVVDFSSPANLIPTLKQKLQLEDKILRYLLVVKEEPVKEKASKA